MPDFVYLIYKGECILTLKTNKYLQDALFSEHGNGAPQLSHAAAAESQEIVPRGLLSSTTLSSQIGSVSSSSWVGEETAILKEPINYTVTAKGAVSALQIKVSSLSLLPSDCLSELVKKTKGKIVWISHRLVQLSETNAHVLNEDMPNRIYQKSITGIQQRFPQANPSALKHLRRVVLKDEAAISPSTLHKIRHARFGGSWKKERNSSFIAGHCAGTALGDYADEDSGESNSPSCRKPIVGGRLIKLVPIARGGEEGKQEASRTLKLSQASTIRVAGTGARHELVPTVFDSKGSGNDPYSILPELVKRCSRRDTKSKRTYSFIY